MRCWRFGLGVALSLFSCSPLLAADKPKCHYWPAATLPLRYENHRLVMDGSVNGQPVQLFIDTGSFTSMLTREAADRLHLPLQETSTHMYGVAGDTHMWAANTKEMTIGIAHGEDAVIAVFEGKAYSYDGLVGDDFLFRSDVEFAPEDKTLKYFLSENCSQDTYLGRWSPSVLRDDLEEGRDRRPLVDVLINGVRFKALIDSGASVSTVDLSAARQLGFDPDTGDTQAAEKITGIGLHQVKSWIVPFDSFALGGEMVKNVKLRVADLWGAARRDNRNDDRGVGETQSMVLGADFLAAHHVLFARSQGKLYFSYVSGRMFQADIDAGE